MNNFDKVMEEVGKAYTVLVAYAVICVVVF
jgi:hypothetical protein